MKTHEVEELLGVTKQSLIYYEKEGMIHPRRDQNNYRDYSQEDIHILELILMLRSMEVSIDDICLILNNQLSIREALETKKTHLEKAKISIEDIDHKIQEHMKRHKVKVSFHHELLENWSESETLFLNEGQFKYNDIEIHKDDICSVHYSMCSQIALVRAWQVFLNYYVDVDIVTQRDTYSFQIMNNEKVREMFDYFADLSVHDPLHLVELYHTKKDKYALYRYLELHFKKWADEYGLDNPRDGLTTVQRKYATSQKITQDIQESLKKGGLDGLINLFKEK